MDRKWKTIFFLFQGLFREYPIVSYCWDVECTINLQNFMKIVRAIFDKMKILNIFLMWTSLNFEGRSKTKKMAGDICKGTPDTEFERDWFRPRVRKSRYWGEILQSPIHCYDVTKPPYLFSGELCTSSLHCKLLFVYICSVSAEVSASLYSKYVNQTSYWRSGRQ